MSESKAPQSSASSVVSTTDGQSARFKSIQTEWTRQVNLVRKQEFAYLRGVLKRDAGDASGRTLAGVPVRAPTAARGRGDTVKKIDEIEAQLNLLWHSTRSKLAESGFNLGSTLSGLALSQTATLTTKPRSTAPQDLAGGATQTMRHTRIPDSELLVQAALTAQATADANGLGPGQNLLHAPTPPAPPLTPTEATVSRAATLFARADYEQATQVLVRTLRTKGERMSQLPRLLALLEIYRATGNQTQFDWSVLEYFDYWDGHTPQWHPSVTERTSKGRISQGAPAANSGFASSGLDDARVWRCPAVLNASAARKLCAHWRTNRHCGIDWTGLSTLAADASAELVACFTQAQGAPTKLIFVDTPNLLYVLEEATPQGQPQVARSLWDLRFCLLGLMQMRAAFDDAATDFCLTYIEPAPAWVKSKIHFIGDALVSAPVRADAHNGTPWHLSGHVVGETGLGLPELPTHPKPQRIAINCASLVRMDADATAQLLQWLRDAEAQKAEVHLQEVGLLVGAAWAAAGIGALAQIQLRDLA